ncbi:MAG TPA: HD domain-containing phosphohydrolase [Planctomycetota bacterium]|nr:HD domain-containing phosphohydrolase [Planctomycetota bacterium]
MTGSEGAEWLSLERSAVLVVDDDEGVRKSITRFLELDGYSVLSAGTLAEARELLATREVLVVLSDITMQNGDNGLDLLAEVRERRPDLDVLLMTGNSDLASAIEALKRGAYDYLRKPFAFDSLRAALRRAVERRHLMQKALMLQQLEERRAADRENLEQFLVAMATMIDAKSSFTARHSARVSDLSRLLAEAMGFDAERVERVALGGRLHDIGKIGTPDSILDKPGALTIEEFRIMKLHPLQGDELIAPIRSLDNLRPIIRWHHESLDGHGYPDGLPGHQVPVEAFVVKVADYWEAITSRRPYRAPMPLEQAVRTLRAEAGVRIPSEIVETFLSAIGDAPIALPPVDA